jgi:hypothetical protein
MISPTQVGRVFAGVMLAALISGGLDLASAGPIAATGEAAGSPTASTGPAVAPQGRAYLFRGALGRIFSRGIDHLTDRLQRAGLTANSYEFTLCRLIADRAIREYREKPAPITLIGHSMGGYCALKFAEMLQDEGIPVSLVVTIDPAHVAPNVPLNVERYINIFLSKNVLGGGDVKPRPGYQGHYASFDLTEHDEVSHINIDKMEAVHEQLVAKVLQLATTPAKTESEAVPLRYVVPPHTAVELWDSGMPVFARPDDSLQTIATQYHVPIWSIAQINRGADSTPLVPGERVVVPRHLEPPAQVSERSSSAH